MSPLYLSVFYVLIGFTRSYETKSECYGKDVMLPKKIQPNQFTDPLYFYPSDGRKKKLVMDKGEILDPRLRVLNNRVYVQNVNFGDTGTFTWKHYLRDFDILSLKVLDCAKQIKKLYGTSLEYRIPAHADFVEFMPLNSEEPITLWNRTDPQIREMKGEIRENVWTVSSLTQSHNGHYNFRRNNYTLEARLRLLVEERTDYYHGDSKFLFIEYPLSGVPWTIKFQPYNKEPVTVMTVGQLLEHNDFFDEININSFGIGIYLKDIRGIFNFKDPEGNLALSFSVDVIPENQRQSPLVTLCIGVGCVVLLGCCCFCCLRKCCKKDKSSTPASGEPAVQFHEVNQPPHQQSNQQPSAIPHLRKMSASPKESRRPFGEPPSYQSVIQAEVTPPAYQESSQPPSFSSTPVPSDAEPRFELKGFHSPAPLSSDSPLNDVYMSDKLNFM